MTSPIEARVALREHSSDGSAWRWWHSAIALAVSALGLAMRVSNARTIHGYGRVSDFAPTVSALEVMARDYHLLDPAGPEHNAYHGPLWYLLAAPILRYSDQLALAGWERFALPAMAMSVSAWVVRQLIVNAAMREAVPERPWATVAALALHAVLPVSAYQDGVLYNESMHATLFAAALLYLLRLERTGAAAMSTRDAALFGVLAGLGLITKTTSVVLPLAALALLAAWLWRAGRRWPFVARDAFKPGLWALGGWLVTAGWWCAWNLQRFGLPFPHQYNIRRLAVIVAHPVVAEPLLYHRPLGWFLPFDTSLLATPYAEWPRPNFWVQMIAGTWVDDINHGFCRMVGGPVRVVWNAPLSARCEEVSRELLSLGLWLTLVAVVVSAWSGFAWLRTRGQRGSLMLSFVTGLTVLLLAAFGTQYPFDHHPVVKASYGLPLAAPLCACVGLALGANIARARDLGAKAWRRIFAGLLSASLAAAIAGVAWLVALELWG